MIRNLEGLEMP